MTLRRIAGSASSLLLLAGCVTTSPAGPRGELGELVDARAGVEDAIPPEQDEESRARVRERVSALLGEPLTPERAVQVALLNNRMLQATLEELGVAQAELVQAGLLENPMIGGDLVVSTRGYGLGGGLSFSQSLLSVFLVPAKRRIAKARLEQAIVVVGHAVLALVRDVKVAHVNVQAAMAMREVHLRIVQAAEVADALAERQLAAKTMPELDRIVHAAALDEARLELADAALAVTVAREELSRLLGVWGQDVGWTLAGGLAEPFGADPALGELEVIGVRERLDLSAARFEVASLERAVELRRRGIVPDVAVGMEARNEVGNDEGHEWVLGPSLSIELPIFDPGHADLARLRAELRRAQHELQHKAVVARSEIRLHRAALESARSKAVYVREQALPRQAKMSKLALERYNAMLIGTYDLLEIRTEGIEVEEHAVEALRDYWAARAELELAIGGRLESEVFMP